MKIFVWLFLMISGLFCPTNAVAQDEEASDVRSFFVGVHAGGYFANKNTAFFYNGNNTYGVQRILSTRIYNDQLDQEFQYSWKFGEFPEKMRYNPAFAIGGHIGTYISDGFALVLNAHFVRLKLQDVVTFQVDDPNNNMVGPSIVTAPITGAEQRFHVDIGFQHDLSNRNNTSFYWSGAINGTVTQFEENTIKVGNLPAWNIGDPFWFGNGGVTPRGFGIGGQAGLGMKFRFNEQLVFDLGYQLIYTTIKLNHERQTTPFQDRGLQHMLYARIIWG